MTETFDFQGFAIPVDLAILTGGGPDTWEGISRAHMDAYSRYAPIRAGHRVVEVGCGVGRDAIPLVEILGTGGAYVGVDVSGPSIEWCQRSIAAAHPNFSFHHLNVRSAFYNPGGTLGAREVTLPIGSGQVDRAILQSVFTHMFEADIVHYLRELRRVLRPGGLIFASFFVLDDEALSLAERTGQGLRFAYPRSNGCRIDDPATPEGAVGYSPGAIDRMLAAAGLRLAQPVHRGSWSGRDGVPDGQDIAVLERAGVVSGIGARAAAVLRRLRRRGG